MNPYTCRVALRPRTPLEVADLATRLVRQHGAEALRADAWTTLPTLAFVVGLSLLPSPWDLSALIAAWIAAPVFKAPATVLLGRALFADDVRASALATPLRAARTTTLGLLATQGALVVSGLGCCFVGWAPMQVAAIFLPHAMLLEQSDLARGLLRSAELASNQLGAAIAGVVIEWLIVLWCAVTAEATMNLLTSQLLLIGHPVGDVSTGDITPWLVTGFAGGYLISSFFLLLLYVDARTRREGWDIQVALRAAAEQR